MRALTWHGKNDIRCETVPDPKIQNGRDAIIKVTACAICGSDLHLFDGVMPSMEKGDVLGHETMGEVVEVGSENKKLKVGDRVVVPFTISCGECFFCKKGLFSCCDRTNPNAEMAIKAITTTTPFSPLEIAGARIGLRDRPGCHRRLRHSSPDGGGNSRGNG
jgi:threonine dehydrogenase-like Zn-dependent dehydrogenase